ncbi:MAG: hypothetical protein ABIT35_04305 [Chitinophagaceae bacterium]
MYSSIESDEVAGILVGSLFTIFALFTDGVCCAGKTCYTTPKKNNSSINETIEYEKLDTK